MGGTENPAPPYISIMNQPPEQEITVLIRSLPNHEPAPPLAELQTLSLRLTAALDDFDRHLGGAPARLDAHLAELAAQERDAR